ncbi:MAG: hypothetical protein H7210_01830 [Pyrinomonadaceae bacterium]|nr:hypothetical protein [Phycisphaerales bacterium]
MIRFLALILFVLIVGAIVAPGLRQPVSWLLAFLSLLMLADLVRSSFAKHHRDRSSSASRRA